MIMSKKNVGIVLDKEFYSDIRVRKEADILVRNGFNVFVLCYSFKNYDYSKVHPIEVTSIKLSKKLKNILFFLFQRLPIYELLWSKKIRQFIQKNSIDTIHVHDLYMSKCTHKAIKLSKKYVELILDLHENYPVAVNSYNWTKGSLRGFLANTSIWFKKEKEYLSYADKIIVLSDNFKNSLIERYDFLKSETIYPFDNSIDLKKFESFPIITLPKTKNKTTFFYFGIIGQRRGVFTLLSVFQKAIKKGLKIDLLFVGPIDKADENTFKEWIANPSIKEYVNHIPWIDLSELPSYLNSIDICVCPLIKNAQHESGIANKIFQYLFGAKAIIASDCLPQQQLIENYNCGLIYANEDEFLACIEQLVNDESLRKKMGENGKKMLYHYYNNQEQEDALIQIFK
tara:strand:+ start:1345 stop:2541 length:1197 start_codon:yes stop_codon:yes gene_type:complete